MLDLFARPFRAIFLVVTVLLVISYVLHVVPLILIGAVVLLMTVGMPLWLSIGLVFVGYIAVASVVPHAYIGAVPLVILGLVAVVPVLRVGRLVRALYRPRPRSRGARWATMRDLRRAGFLAAHGWPVGGVGREVVRLPDERQSEGVLLVAPPGSGKSSGLAIPTILSEADRAVDDRRSLVVGDPKDELTRITMATLMRTHHALVWDPGDAAECTVTFDPLAMLPAPTSASYLPEVHSLADGFFWASRHGEHSSDPFFITQPMSMLRAVVLTFLSYHPQGSFVEMGDWLRSLTSFEQFVDAVEGSVSPAARSFAGTLRSLALNERAVGGIFADITQRFDVLDTPAVRAAMQRGPRLLAWERVVADPTVVYVRVPARESERLQPLLSLFFASMYRQLAVIAERQPTHRLPRGVRVILEEFGNLGRIHGIETALATLRSYGVGHFVIVQTTAQLVRHYGKTLAQSIQDNLVTKLVLGGAADEDARWMSHRSGEIVEYHASSTVTDAGMGNASASSGWTPERRPLISPSEIMHMHGVVLMSTRGLPPVLARLMPYFTDRALVQRMQDDARDLAATRAQHAHATTASVSPPVTEVSPQPVPPASPLSLSDDLASIVEALPRAVPTSGGKRDVPPPGSSVEEWEGSPRALREARWSLEDDAAALADGSADLAAIQERWRATWPQCSPGRYAKITDEEAVSAPTVWFYIQDLAWSLELPSWLKESGPTPSPDA